MTTPVDQASLQPVTLTEREREVVALIAQGLDTEDIAEELFLSRATVKEKIKRIRGKVGGERMTDLPALVEALDRA